MARKVPVAVHGEGKELPPLFDKCNFHDDACAIADCTFFDLQDSHYGTANASPDQERVVAFFQFVPSARLLRAGTAAGSKSGDTTTWTGTSIG